MKTLPLLYCTIVFSLLFSFCAVADTALWIPPAQDLVGTGTTVNANGINDWHIRIDSSRLAGAEPAAWRVRGGLWFTMVDKGQWRLPYDKGFSGWESYLKVEQSGSFADLYFEPLLAWPGMIFEVEAVLSTKNVLRWQVLSNGEGWQPGAEWRGQGPMDILGNTKPLSDGIREWDLYIAHEFLESRPIRVDVWLPYRPIGSRLQRGGCYELWSTEKYTPFGSARPLSFSQGNGDMTVSINPVLATGGDEFFVRAVLADNRWAMWKVIGMGSDWETGGKWFGQDSDDYVSVRTAEPNGVRDWRLQVSSPRLNAPVRWIVRGAKTTWEYVPAGTELQSPRHHLAYVVQGGNTADLYLDPVAERAGDIFYVSAVLSDGSVVSWGVTSVHQLRSTEVVWQGQVEENPMFVAQGPVTNVLRQWKIVVQHDRLEEQTPWQWRIKRGSKLWQEPRLTDEDIKKLKPLTVETDGRRAQLYIKPEFARPGDQYEVEALFNDGTLIQWTALADGAEWARAGVWRTDTAEDRVGLAGEAEPDGVRDWDIMCEDELLNSDSLVQLDVTGLGWRWTWPYARNISPVSLQQKNDTMQVFIAPASRKKPDDAVITIRGLFESGILRYWQAIEPDLK